MNYPNGLKKKNQVSITTHKNRGMTLENELNISNEYYREIDKAYIYKKPTPVQITKVDYPSRDKAMIKEGFFTTPSTTDYNGLYKGYYIDFEAKETKSTSKRSKKVEEILDWANADEYLCAFGSFDYMKDILYVFGKEVKGWQKCWYKTIWSPVLSVNGSEKFFPVISIIESRCFIKVSGKKSTFSSAMASRSLMFCPVIFAEARHTLSMYSPPVRSFKESFKFLIIIFPFSNLCHYKLFKAVSRSSA